MSLKVIIFGSSGMVGEGILRVCLAHADVESILAINRKPISISSPKLETIIHQDIFDLSPIENQLIEYNACFYCIGSTNPLAKESEYFNITHNLTLYVAGILARLNPNMIFCYVSGFGADSNSRIMQTRVKGVTEDDLFRTSFKRVYSFRPGILKAVKGQKNVYRFYNLFNFLYPVFRFLLPGFVLSLNELGLAMINTAQIGFEKHKIEVRDIVTLARKNN